MLSLNFAVKQISSPVFLDNKVEYEVEFCSCSSCTKDRTLSNNLFSYRMRVCYSSNMLWWGTLYIYIYKCINIEETHHHWCVLLHHTLLVSWKELTPGNLSSSGTKTCFKIISPFWTMRKPILFSIFVAFSPGTFFFTIYLKQKYKKHSARNADMENHNANA